MASIISAGTTSGTSLNLSGDTSGVLQLATNGSTTAMTVDTSQRVGIGTTTSSAGGLLTLNRAPTAAFGSPILQIGGSSYTSGGYYSIGLGFTDATYTEPPAEIAYVPTSDSGGTLGSIVFGTRSVTTNTAVTERMRITSAGNVGIGTTSPTAPLTVYAAQYNTMRIGRSDAASFAVGIPNGSATDALQFYGFQAGYDGYLFTGASGDKLYLNTNGNVVLKGGTAAASGVGITFPATQVASSDANCLDDYEEGTWTPSISALSSAPTGVTYSTRNGTYTKIGSLVYVSCDVFVNSIGTGGSGRTAITGLPFTSASNSIYTPCIGHSEGLLTGFTSQFVPLVYPNESQIQLYLGWNGTGGPTNFDYATYMKANNTGFRIFVVYRV